MDTSRRSHEGGFLSRKCSSQLTLPWRIQRRLSANEICVSGRILFHLRARIKTFEIREAHWSLVQ